MLPLRDPGSRKGAAGVYRGSPTHAGTTFSRIDFASPFIGFDHFSFAFSGFLVCVNTFGPAAALTLAAAVCATPEAVGALTASHLAASLEEGQGKARPAPQPPRLAKWLLLTCILHTLNALFSTLNVGALGTHANMRALARTAHTLSCKYPMHNLSVCMHMRVHTYTPRHTNTHANTQRSTCELPACPRGAHFNPSISLVDRSPRKASQRCYQGKPGLLSS